MRIITGKYKGLTLKAPKGIRPTEDRVRKALFDILGDVSDLSFLELFAGSGAVGFEALSCGASSVTFVEKDQQGVRTIKENLDALKVCGCAEVIACDALAAVNRLGKSGRKFDLVFLDPPYYGKEAQKTLQILGDCDILQPSGLVIIQHFKKDILPETSGILRKFKQSKYGDTVLSFYKIEL